jgi:hypothetical protein
MGTRNLTKVIDIDGITRVAQYGQWDGYPEYTGKRILDFISEYKMLDKIDGYDMTDDGLWSIEEATRFGMSYPSLTRDTGCDIIKVIVYSNGNDIPLQDESEFENDDLYCEGVYTLNYQTREFISKWNDNVVSFSFDELPTAEIYIKSFMKDLTNA